MAELTYTRNGDYLIPDIQLEETDNRPLGRYGRMRRAYLQENNTLLYNHLILTGKLWEHLLEIQDAAESRMEQIMDALLKADPAPDKKDRPDGLGTAHERAEGAGRGSDPDGTYQQLSFIFPTEAEQIAYIDTMDRAEAEKAPAFSMPEQEEIPEPINDPADVEGSVFSAQDAYDRFYPQIRELVLADTAYRNACVNSDRETARIEGQAAVQRAALTIQDADFMRMYFDSPEYSERMRDSLIEETYGELASAKEATAEEAEEVVPETPISKAEKPLEETTVESENASLAKAMELINEYSRWEFGDDADFSDLERVDIAYTTTEDEDLPIQVSADLINLRMCYEVDEKEVAVINFADMDEFNDFLASLDFSEEITFAEDHWIEEQEEERSEERELSGNAENAEETAGTDESQIEAVEKEPKGQPETTKPQEQQNQRGLGYSYAVGDTVYLDNKAFQIEDIGLFDVHLRDLSTIYPIFRAENKYRFENMLWHDDRNERFLPHEVQKEAAAPEAEKTENEPATSGTENPEIEPSIDETPEVTEPETDKSDEAVPNINAQETETSGNTSPETATETGEPQITTETTGYYSGEKNKLPFDVVIEKLHIDKPQHEVQHETSAPQRAAEPQEAVSPSLTPEPQHDPILASNFHIMDDHLGEGGPKEKFWRNIKAIATLKQLESENRNAAPEEQHILSQFVGWGGLADAFDENRPAWAAEYSELKGLLTEDEYAAARASTLNAHYTSPTVIRAIYDAVGQMGFESGNILEPAMGVGNFFGMLPDSMQGSRLYGVELDSITGRIAQKLYPNAEIKVAGFETTDRRDFYDLAVGNVPFGNYKVNDKAYNKLGFNIHNYFFAKALDQVRPGGIVAFVTSRFTMNSKNPEMRKYLAQRADLLGAIRLPNNAFLANAGTGVTSDIIFLQKRDRPIDIEPDWVHLGLTPDNIPVNSYFADHPEMVLGTLSTESTQYGRDDVTVKPIPGADLGEQLKEAVSRIQGIYEPAEVTADELLDVEDTVPADPDVKNFSYAVRDGEVYFRENSVMRHMDLNETAKGRVVGMVELRRIVNELIDYQMEDYPDEDIEAKQRELNTAYDAFYERYGTINSKANAQVFAEDSSYYLLCSLENIDEDGRLESKADMFTKRTIRPEQPVTSVDTPSEALAVSIGSKGKVDLPYMAELLGTPGEYDTIISELTGVIFRDPLQADSNDITKGWQTADEYLSGDVRTKLKMARITEQSDPSYTPNVTALEKAQPKDLDASEIDVRLGATWIDTSVIQKFMEETFDPPWYMRRKIQVNFSPVTAEWQITGKSTPSAYDVAAYATYGTSRANAYKILEDTLNLRDVRIYDTVEDADGKQKRVLNKKETTLAQQKQQAIKDAFQDWVWKDPQRREALVKKYNELFNSARPREYDGSHIQFVGMNPDITLREHQRGAIAHVLYGGNTLLAHEVGAGKTFEMAAAAMEAKRLGLCQKSMFVVPNHLTMQWANEFLRLYPSAKILVATKKDFETARRKKFCARIATGDYDAVIIGHSQFEKIPISPERQESLLREQIDEIEEGIAEAKQMRGENFTIKQMEKTRKSLQAKLDKLLSTDRKDDVITFEQLGVDRLFVDEAHAFKNLFLFTKMRNVAGLSTSEAQKSSDMFMKCRYMDELTGGKGVVFATGTPVSNSMTELYTMMRYLQYDTLQQKGLSHFDCWASTFGETTTAIELAPEGYTF